MPVAEMLVASLCPAVCKVEVSTSVAADTCGNLEFASAVFISMAALNFADGKPAGTFAGSATDLIPAFDVEFVTAPTFPILAVVPVAIDEAVFGVTGVLVETAAGSIPRILSGENAVLPTGINK